MLPEPIFNCCYTQQHERVYRFVVAENGETIEFIQLEITYWRSRRIETHQACCEALRSRTPYGREYLDSSWITDTAVSIKGRNMDPTGLSKRKSR
jgi:hypothetical protein